VTESVCILGLGAVGRALSAGMRAAGRPTRAWSRSASSRAAAHPDVRVEEDLGRALDGADWVLFAVRDEALAGFARDVARILGDAPATPRVALHTCGALAAEVLAPLAELGGAERCATGVLHPLLPLPPTPTTEGAPRPWSPGAAFGVSGQERAVAAARALVADLRGHALHLPDGPRSAGLYHAAATLLANGAVSLFDAALELLERAGATGDRQRALAALLAEGAHQLGERGPERAQTGPIVRGDAQVVARHIALLEERDDDADARGDLASLYRLLSRRLLDLAQRSGRLDALDVQRIRVALEGE
jgi:predicted short-subunit dehydrogenase-like oxidoreductase (DUF2520 family)